MTSGRLQRVVLLLLLAGVISTVLSYDHASSEGARRRRGRSWGRPDDSRVDRGRPEVSSSRAGDWRRARADRYRTRYESRRWRQPGEVRPTPVTGVPASSGSPGSLSASDSGPADHRTPPAVSEPTAATADHRPHHQTRRPQDRRRPAIPGDREDRRPLDRPSATEDPLVDNMEADSDRQPDIEPYEQLKGNRTVTRRGKCELKVTVLTKR